MGAEQLTIGALSQQSGVHIVTIRYYERLGIMPAPRRSHGGYRLYGPDHLKRLNFVRRGRELGFELEELREMLLLVDGRNYTCAEVYSRTARHAAAVRRKIADLRRLQRALDEMVADCPQDDSPDCPIIDALLEAKPSRRKRAYQEAAS